MHKSAVLCSALVFLLFAFVSADYCLHGTSDSNSGKIYNATDLLLTDVRSNHTMDTCGSMDCNGISDCQICQWNEYCTAFHSSAQYYALPPQNYTGKTGYTMYFRGDSIYCGFDRQSYVYVLCGQPTNSFTFLNEWPACTYSYEIHLTSACTFNAPVPNLQITFQTGTSMEVQVLIDDHLWELPFLQASFLVTLDGKNAYSGVYQSFVLSNLPTEPVYSLAVQGTYNGYTSPMSAIFSVNSIKGNSTDDQLIEEKIDVLGTQLTQMDKELAGDLDVIEQQLSVDVLGSVKNTEQQTMQIQQQLNELEAKMDDLKSGGGSSGGNGGFVALGLVLGLLVGIGSTILVMKFLLKIDLTPSKSGRYNSVLTTDDDA